MAGRKEYELALKIEGLVGASLNTSCNLTKKQLRSIANEAARATADTVSFTDAMSKAGPGIDAAWGGMKKTVMTTAQAMAAAGAAGAAVAGASISVGKEFESAMSSWSATANATPEDYRKAREAAMEMGRTTSKTATESAQALEYMALAGWSVEDSIAGLPGVLRLSEATGLELARTSDLVTDSMSALGIEVEELDGYLDVAAKANNKSNQTAEQLMEAYLGVGGTMKNLNVPLEQSATALGVLANRGIKGSEAGNALNAVMVNLTTGTGQAGKMMGSLGISAFDSQGKFIGLRETLGILNTALKGLSEEERNAALAAIGGKQHVDALNDLMSGLNTTVADGVSEWDSLEKELGNAGGALEQMAATKLDNLEGDLAILQSALQDSGIQIYDNLQEPLREGTQLAAQYVYDFTDDIIGRLERAVPTVKRNMLDAKEAVEDFAEPLLKIGGWMADNPDVIAGGLAAVGTTITTLKVAQSISNTAQAMNALRAAMVSNPLTAVLGIAAMAGGAIIGISTKVKLANAELKRQNLAGHFGDISLSLEELEDAAVQIIDNGSLGRLSSAMDEFEKASDIAETLSENQAKLDKLNWKIGMDFELSESELSDYGTQIDEFVKNAIAFGEQQQYAMNLNLELLTGDDETGRDIIAQFNSFYDSMNAELRDYGEQLGEAYSEGMKDGVLSMDEVETIQELQRKMADITAKLSSSQFEAKMETAAIKYGGGQLDAETFQNLQSEIQTQVDAAAADLQESLTMNIAGAKLQLDEGAIDIGQYGQMVSEFKENYLEQIGEIQLKASRFQTDTLYAQYGEELDTALPRLEEFINGRMEDYFSSAQAGGNTDLHFDVFMKRFEDGLTKDSRDALTELWENMSPDLERLEEIRAEYQKAGKALPEELAKSISDMAALGVIAGSQDALFSYIGSSMADNEQYVQTMQALQDMGREMPEEISAGLKENEGAITDAADRIYSNVERYIRNKFGTFDVDSSINMNFSLAGNGKKLSGKTLTPHADGGIFDQPHMGVFAESGPEAFIPIDRSGRSVSVWRQTGEMLGVMGNNGELKTGMAETENTSFSYSPVYQIYGADEETVRRATSDDYDRFEQLMARYQKDRRRLGF